MVALTSNVTPKFNYMETGTADRAAVCAFHPWCQALIVEVMTTGNQVSDQFFVGRLIRVDMIGSGNGVAIRIWYGSTGIILQWRLGKGI